LNPRPLPCQGATPAQHAPGDLKQTGIELEEIEDLL